MRTFGACGGVRTHPVHPPGYGPDHVLLVPTIFFGSTKTADSRIRHFRDLLIIRSLSNRDFKTRAANGSELFFLTT